MALWATQMAMAAREFSQTLGARSPQMTSSR
jgi:hypothetical protein